MLKAIIALAAVLWAGILQGGPDLDADLILRDGVMPTLAGGATAVAIAGGRIAAVGGAADVMERAGPDTEVIDCGGRAIVPGLVDAHCHIFAAAAAGRGVDCRPAAAPDRAAIIRALRARAAANRGGGWVRGYGYDDSPIGLGRHLNRYDLDAVATGRPVRVEHRSGHACVLNSAGLRAVGIGRDTPEPPGGVIVRDAGGEPTGRLLEMSGWLRERAGGSAGGRGDFQSSNFQSGDFRAALGQLGRRLAGYGITAVTDAGPDNGIDRWHSFADAIGDERLPLRVTMMAGIGRLPELADAGLGCGADGCGGRLRLGHAKIMLTASAGGLHPHPEELAAMAAAARRAGYPAAIHAVERDAIVAAALTLADIPPPAGRQRIEHCAECPPDVAELVRQSGAQATLNPGFLHYDGERYQATLPPELLAHLYPAGALDAVGIPVAFGSDAPVIEPNPWAAMAAAATRRSGGGAALGGVGLPSVRDALRMHCGGNRIAPGGPADLAVVAPNPLAATPADLAAVRAVATVVGGRVVWRDGV